MLAFVNIFTSALTGPQCNGGQGEPRPEDCTAGWSMERSDEEVRACRLVAD